MLGDGSIVALLKYKRNKMNKILKRKALSLKNKQTKIVDTILMMMKVILIIMMTIIKIIFEKKLCLTTIQLIQNNLMKPIFMIKM